MELLRGETLASHMDAKRRFTLEETMAIVLPLLSALAHAHAQGIVHRDLKPDNVFLVVDPDGHVIPKILDFGISKLMQPAAPKITTDGSMLGTPNYMSPEQARGQADVNARSDVFAAGILVYEMLSGDNPFATGATTPWSRRSSSAIRLRCPSSSPRSGGSSSAPSRSPLRCVIRTRPTSAPLFRKRRLRPA